MANERRDLEQKTAKWLRFEEFELEIEISAITLIIFYRHPGKLNRRREAALSRVWCEKLYYGGFNKINL